MDTPLHIFYALKFKPIRLQTTLLDQRILDSSSSRLELNATLFPMPLLMPVKSVKYQVLPTQWP